MLQKKSDQVILLSILLTFISCSMDHNIPTAEIKLLNFQQSENKNPLVNIYEINFTSNIPVDSLIRKNGGDPYLYCTLNGNNDFGIDETNINNPNLSGSFKRMKDSLQKNDLIHYSAEVVFYNSYKAKQEYLTKEQIKKKIAENQCVDCKIITRFFMDTRKPYLSNPMCIPVEDILKIIK